MNSHDLPAPVGAAEGPVTSEAPVTPTRSIRAYDLVEADCLIEDILGDLDVLHRGVDGEMWQDCARRCADSLQRLALMLRDAAVRFGVQPPFPDVFGCLPAGR